MPKQKKPKANNPFPAMEEEVLSFWEKAKTFEKSVKKSAPKGDYVFYDGPPFATGLPHYGHIVASIMKDTVPRYWTMKGFRVERRWGWDCHGLPIENLAEKELKLKDKNDIEKIGVKKFNEYSESIVLRYAEEWKKIINRIGRWADMENDYKTMDIDYMESIWWVFKSLWDKGLIYKGNKAMHICPRCGTTLSNFEVTQGYKDIKDLSVTAKFELVDPTNLRIGYEFTNKDKVYILAWTTTPWTLIGNVALAVGNNIDYSIIARLDLKTDKKEYFIFANAFFSTKIFSEENNKDKINIKVDDINDDKLLSEAKKLGYSYAYEVLDGVKSAKLIGLKYKPLFDYYTDDKSLANLENGWKVYAADFVSTEEGTGVVHIAPAFGEDDMKMGKEHNLPFIQHVDMSGRFKKEVKDFVGMEVKPKDDHQATDVEIIKYLAKKDLLFAKEKYDHSYPHCWRCDTPLLNYATTSWFLEVTKIKKDLVKNNKDINWVPDNIKEGRFGRWLEEARDWAISRNRYWGTPLPVWRCDGEVRSKKLEVRSAQKCGSTLVIGSIEELEKLSGKKIKNLHKQYVDEITFKCKKCKGIMKRIPEVLDCWFESGSMPYAQNHYMGKPLPDFDPKKGKNFPANFIAEGVDQTRGWFYTLMVLSTALFKKEAFQNVIVNGIVLSEDGAKMSKRLNNYPDPAMLFDKYSVDALRYYLLSSSVLTAENLNFSEEGVKESLRKVEMILWNVYKFYEMFSDALSPNPSPDRDLMGEGSKNVLDKWIIARLNQLITETTKNMDNYVIPKAIRPIGEFIDDLSTWYIRRSRDRFKSSSAEASEDKVQAIQTTKFVLQELSKVMAPFMPFIAEQIWQKVTGNDFKNKEKSVHLESWPVVENRKQKTDDRIINDMKSVREAVRLGLSARDIADIKVRQPLSLLYIDIINYNYMDEAYSKLVKEEVNVNDVQPISDQGGKAIKRERGIVRVKDGIFKGRYANDKDGSNFVSLKLDLTLELKLEGTQRELIRTINMMRKELNLTIKDRINIFIETKSEDIKTVVDDKGKYYNDIISSVLSYRIARQGLKPRKSSEDKFFKEVKINGESVTIGIQKIK